jgi:hypothetical protein
MGLDGWEFPTVFQKVPERGYPIGKFYPLVVIEEENAEPSQAGYGDKVFRTVNPIAEGGSEVHQAGNRKILFGRSAWDRARKEKRNQEQGREELDPFENGKPLASTHEICDNSKSTA